MLLNQNLWSLKHASHLVNNFFSFVSFLGIRYESEFFQNVVNGRDIVSWGAVDRNRPNGQSDELIGFVTARTVLAKASDVSLSSFLLVKFSLVKFC